MISEQNIQTLNQAYMSNGNFASATTAQNQRKMRGPKDSSSKPGSINKVP